MCGIAGTIGIADPDTIGAMTDALHHRGPDDSDVRVWPEAGVAFGHRRLAIIDLTAAGRQPMSYAEERFWITFNGEIYNYRDLRRQLQAAGHRFRTHCDTEVILAAYAEWGTECLHRFRGMFAFAIADFQERRVFLARDRFGIKPLLLAQRAGAMLFASELRALLCSGKVERRLDREALWHYLSLGSVPQPLTILRGVEALPAGHARIVGFDAATQRQWRWWNVAEAAADHAGRTARMTFHETAEALRAGLEDATRHHLVADVPVGAFLSGGVDSAAMVGLMQQHLDAPLQTFTVGFESKHQQLSETEWAAATARHFGTRHTEVIITDREGAECYDQLIDARDQPSMDGANTWFVSRAAGADVKVALTGLAGDELFAGYPHFRRHLLAARLAPTPRRRRLLSVLRLLPERFRHNLMLPALTPAERLATLRCLAGDHAKNHMLTPEAKPADEPSSLTQRSATHLRSELDTVTQLSVYELECYLCNTLLRDGDVMSMAHSLETRPILLDHQLAAFALAIPSEFKIRNGQSKAVFLAALRDILPPAVVKRPKRGFELPLLRWLSGTLLERARQGLNSDAASMIFSAQFLADAQRRLPAPAPRDFRLWPYVVLLEWIQQHRLTL